MSGVEYLPNQQAGPPFLAPPLPPPSEVASAEPVFEEMPAPARRRRFVPRSLTSRIVIGVVALVVVLVAAIGTWTYVALRSSLITRLDQQVASAGSQNATFFSRCFAQSANSGGNCYGNSPPQTQREWVALLSTSGSVAATISSGPVSSLTLSADQRRELAEDPGRIIDVTYDSHELRVTGRDTPLGLLVVTGLSTGDVDDTLRHLVALEVLAGSAAILLAFGATTYGVRLSLRRLRRVTMTAQDVADELSPEGAGLDRRVPDDEPESEVGQLATSFNTMLAAVETQFAARIASEERMRQFLADASHELRTPLTSIRGYAELARMQRAVGDIAEDNLDRIEAEGTRMSRLVEDLLMLARDEDDNHPAQRVPLDVTELLDDVAHGTRAAFPDRPIEVEAAAMPAVLGDHDQLLRVVRNLVTNAAVHTDAARPIVIRGFPAAGGVSIQVVDGGPGLAPDDAAHVFERFWRADKARTRVRGGSGLGLSIVASIVRSHGGSVRFDSTVERGSTVTVWLPGAPPAATPLALD